MGRKRESDERTRTFLFVTMAFRCTRFKGNTRLVLLSLADRADITGLCWCGYEDIMERANCSRSPVAEALRELADAVVEGKPLLRVERRYGKCNRYVLDRAVLTALARPNKSQRPAEETDVETDDMSIQIPNELQSVNDLATNSGCERVEVQPRERLEVQARESSIVHPHELTPPFKSAAINSPELNPPSCTVHKDRHINSNVKSQKPKPHYQDIADDDVEAALIRVLVDSYPLKCQPSNRAQWNEVFSKNVQRIAGELFDNNTDNANQFLFYRINDYARYCEKNEITKIYGPENFFSKWLPKDFLYQDLQIEKRDREALAEFADPIGHPAADDDPNEKITTVTLDDLDED